jgi:hypothetical protein
VLKVSINPISNPKPYRESLKIVIKIMTTIKVNYDSTDINKRHVIIIMNTPGDMNG